MTDAHVPGMLLRSKAVSTSTEEAPETLSETSWVLQFPSVDTVGLVSLLAVWTRPSKQAHGMQRAEDRRSCLALLVALCESVGNMKFFV